MLTKAAGPTGERFVVLGSIGGLLVMGVIGLFIGAIVPVLRYTVMLIGLDIDAAMDTATHA